MESVALTATPDGRRARMVAEFSNTETALAEIEALASGLRIDGLEDRKGYEAVHGVRMSCVRLRTALDKRRVEIKAPALAECREIDQAAAKMEARILAVETPLLAMQRAVDDERARIKAQEEAKRKELIQSRARQMMDCGVVPSLADLERMDDDQFASVLADAQAAKKARDDAAAAERAERERLEAEERARLKAEDDARREQEALERAERERLQAERAEQLRRIEADQAAERERLQAEAKRIAAENKRLADEQAKREAELRRAEEAKQAELRRAEAEKRRIALQPEVDRVLALSHRIDAMTEETADIPTYRAAVNEILFDAAVAIQALVQPEKQQ